MADVPHSPGFVVEFAARKPGKLAHWWARALGWAEDPPGDAVRPSGHGVKLRFRTAIRPKLQKNATHLDLLSESHGHQQEIVERLFNAGARFTDIGQGDVPWVTMSDPEDNEFCVLEPRQYYTRTGPVAAVVIDCADPSAQARAWASRTGMTITRDTPDYVSLQAATGPHLEFLKVADGPEGMVRVLPING